MSTLLPRPSSGSSSRSRRLPGLLLALMGGALASTAEYYAEWHDTLERAGYHEVYRPVTGTLRQGERTRWNFDVTGEQLYALVAVCDDDCDDLDLRVYDAGGREVGRDLASDDEPLVLTRPARSQRYSVAVIMASCDWNPCRYQLGFFQRGEDLSNLRWRTAASPGSLLSARSAVPGSR